MNALDNEDYSRAYCDGKGCGDAKVRDRVVASLASGRVLAWCYHHGNKFGPALEEQGALIVPLATDV